MVVIDIGARKDRDVDPWMRIPRVRVQNRTRIDSSSSDDSDSDDYDLSRDLNPDGQVHMNQQVQPQQQQQQQLFLNNQENLMVQDEQDRDGDAINHEESANNVQRIVGEVNEQLPQQAAAPAGVLLDFVTRARMVIRNNGNEIPMTETDLHQVITRLVENNRHNEINHRRANIQQTHRNELTANLEPALLTESPQLGPQDPDLTS